VNEAYNTSFDLAVVSEGWNCKWNHKTSNYDTDFVSKRLCLFVSGYPKVTEPARPLIWTWNDNAAEQYRNWHPGLSVVRLGNHWEIFGSLAFSD
jgi:hypothetical protein